MSQWRGVLNRCRIAALCVGASTIILGVAALGQMAQQAPDGNLARDYPPPYDDSKPDQALKIFDQAHPACELWTDWHKLCSRTGPKGTTYCRTDAEHPVTPSPPFCAKGANGFGPPPNMSKVERLSEQRFITGYRSYDTQVITADIIAELKDRPSSKRHRIPKTERHRIPIFDPRRPFAGLTLAQLEHPYCAVWDVEGDDGAFHSCAEDRRAGTPSCKDPKIRNRASRTYPVCVEKIRSRICDPTDRAELNRIVDVMGNLYVNEDIVGYKSESLPVYGYTCPAGVSK